MPDDNELIATLNSRIHALTQENSDLKSESKNRRQSNTTLKAELEKLHEQLNFTIAERDQLQSKVTETAGEKDQKITALETELKSRDLRDRFSRIATAGIEVDTDTDDFESRTLQVRPDAIGPLLRELGLRPDEQGELPDEDQITEALRGAQSSHPWAFSTGETPTVAADAAPQPITTHAAKAGPGAARSVLDLPHKITARDAVNQRFAMAGWGVDGRL